MRDGLRELLEMVYTVDSCIRSRCGGRQDIAYVFVAAERGKHGRALDFASLLSRGFYGRSYYRSSVLIER
jgi:hypothetical protein